MAEKDIAEKTLESYSDVFADIANVLMFGGEQVIHPEDLEDASPRSAYKADGKLRDIERDVVKRWTDGSIRIACLGMENQSASDADMPLRVFAYDGAEYRAQLHGRERYPVITLVLYFGHEKPWNQPVTLYEAARVPDKLKPFVPDMKLNLYQIAYLSPEQVQQFHSDFKIVADYFVQMRVNGNYVPSQEEIAHVQETLQLLSVMTRDHRFEEAFHNAPKGGIRNMSEWLDRVEKKGIEIGMQKGLQKGMQKGLIQGKAEGTMNTLLNLIAKGKLTVSEAAEEAHMSLEEFEKKIGANACLRH